MSVDSNFPQIHRINENSLIIYLSDDIDMTMPLRIASLIDTIKKWPEKIVIDFTPSYTSLLINYDATRISYSLLKEKLNHSLATSNSSELVSSSRRIEIPVYYAPECGPDLEQTAQQAGISVDEVIQLHSETQYLVFALGFMPGFAFMGIVHETLRLPRLSTPRTAVPKGSVAIAEKQTAVYPEPTPGGWRILGRSPMQLFDPASSPPQPYQIGDRITFEPIDREAFLSLGGKL